MKKAAPILLQEVPPLTGGANRHRYNDISVRSVAASHVSHIRVTLSLGKGSVALSQRGSLSRPGSLSQNGSLSRNALR